MSSARRGPAFAHGLLPTPTLFPVLQPSLASYSVHSVPGSFLQPPVPILSDQFLCTTAFVTMRGSSPRLVLHRSAHLDEVIDLSSPVVDFEVGCCGCCCVAMSDRVLIVSSLGGVHEEMCVLGICDEKSRTFSVLMNTSTLPLRRILVVRGGRSHDSETIIVVAGNGGPCRVGVARVGENVRFFRNVCALRPELVYMPEDGFRFGCVAFSQLLPMDGADCIQYFLRECSSIETIRRPVDCVPFCQFRRSECDVSATRVVRSILRNSLPVGCILLYSSRDAILHYTFFSWSDRDRSGISLRKNGSIRGIRSFETTMSNDIVVASVEDRVGVLRVLRPDYELGQFWQVIPALQIGCKQIVSVEGRFSIILGEGGRFWRLDLDALPGWCVPFGNRLYDRAMLVLHESGIQERLVCSIRCDVVRLLHIVGLNFVVPNSDAVWVAFRELVCFLLGLRSTGRSQQRKEMRRSGPSSWEQMLDEESDERGCLYDARNVGKHIRTGLLDAQGAIARGLLSSSSVFRQSSGPICYCLHLLYEDLKVSRTTVPLLPNLARVLLPLAGHLGWLEFVEFYLRDFPELRAEAQDWEEREKEGRRGLGSGVWDVRGQVRFSSVIRRSDPEFSPPHLFASLQRFAATSEGLPLATVHSDYPRDSPLYPLLPCLEFTRIACRLFSVFSSCCLEFDPYGRQTDHFHSCANRYEKVMRVLASEGLTSDKLRMFAFSVCLFATDCIAIFRGLGPFDDRRPSWVTAEFLELLEREDLVEMLKFRPKKSSGASPTELERFSKSWWYYDFDDRRKNVNEILDSQAYFRDIERWRGVDRMQGYRVFPIDRRLDGVWSAMSNTKPYQVTSTLSGLLHSDPSPTSMAAKILMHIFSLSIGKGMLSLSTECISLTERMRFQRVCSIAMFVDQHGQLSRFDVADGLPENEILSYQVRLMPTFHSYVAQTLRFVGAGNDPHHRHYLSREWILSQFSTSANVADAGFIYGLGLLNHLLSLRDTDITRLLDHEDGITTMSLLLGLGVSKVGTRDGGLTRLALLHLPPARTLGASRIGLDDFVLPASLLTLGLLHCESCDRSLSELMLVEIAAPGLSAGNSIRGSYSLCSAFGLGAINLGKGDSSLPDFHLAAVLLQYVEGGDFPPEIRVLLERAKLRHDEGKLALNIGHIKRDGTTTVFGDAMPVENTRPAALVALALIYLKTGNQYVANRLNVGRFSRPTLRLYDPFDVLMMVFASSVILWDDIVPTNDWIEAKIPSFACQVAKDPQFPNRPVHKQQWPIALYVHCLAGGCLAIAFKFAGTFNPQCRQLFLSLREYLVGLRHRYQHSSDVINYAIQVVLLSACSVFSGNGDRELYLLVQDAKVASHSHFGSHFSMSIATGILFLGGGRFSLNTDKNLGVLGLLFALYPRFPDQVFENTVTFQPMRHLYVLASEMRLLDPWDVRRDHPCFCEVEVKCKVPLTSSGSEKEVEDEMDLSSDDAQVDSNSYSFQLRLPGLLPPRSHVVGLDLLGTRYFRIPDSFVASLAVGSYRLPLRRRMAIRPAVNVTDLCRGNDQLVRQHARQYVPQSAFLEVYSDLKTDHYVLLRRFLLSKWLVSGLDSTETVFLEALEKDLTCLPDQRVAFLEFAVADALSSRHALWDMKLILQMYESCFEQEFLEKQREVILMSEKRERTSPEMADHPSGGTSLPPLLVSILQTQLEEAVVKQTLANESLAQCLAGTSSAQSSAFSSCMEYCELPSARAVVLGLLRIRGAHSLSGRAVVVPLLMQEYPRLPFPLVHEFASQVLES